MKTLLTLFILLFSSSVVAEDISDFEIEGMSVGDSLLDYFSEEEINKNVRFFYNDNKFGTSDFKKSYFKTYEYVQFSFKPKDKKYIIYAIEGLIYSIKDINDCLKRKDRIVDELSKVFKNEVRIEDRGTNTHGYDKSGKSKVTDYYFYLDSGGFADVGCYDWSEEISKKEGFLDNLRVTLSSEAFSIFLDNAF